MDREPQPQIIYSFQQGDQDAFRIIYDQTRSYVYSVIYKMVLDSEEAKDLTHDIYIKIFESRKSYNSNYRFTTWLYRIAVNHAINYINKKHSFFTKLPQVFFHQNPEPADEPDYDLTGMQKALKKLKPEYRICVILRDIEDMTYEDIAEQLNINIGTVRSRINRGRAQLLDIYKKEVGQYEFQQA